MKTQAYRHGEILLLKVNKLPKGLKESKTNIIMVGSHGNNHSFDNGMFYKHEDGQTFGYLKAKNTSLFHPEHGIEGKAKIADGYYKLIKQVEYTPDGLVPVID